MDGKSLCEVCGEPMPKGEESFRYHGYSGDCPKPPLPKLKQDWEERLEKLMDRYSKFIGGRPLDFEVSPTKLETELKAFIAAQIELAKADERARILAILDDYFARLIAIPVPELTHRNLRAIIEG